MSAKYLVFTPIWKRPEVTQIWAEGIKRLQKDFDIRAFAVISEKWPQELLKKYGFEWVWHENQPLGRKKNYGLKKVMEKEFDYLIELNSDNIIKSSLIDLYKGDYSGLHNFLILNSADGRCRHFYSEKTYGIGRCYSKKILEKVTFCKEYNVIEGCIIDGAVFRKGERVRIPDHLAEKLGDNVVESGDKAYELWNDLSIMGMDFYSDDKLKAAGVKCNGIVSDDPLGVDIKSKDNIHPFKSHRGIEYDINEFFEGLSDKEVDLIKRLWA